MKGITDYKSSNYLAGAVSSDINFMSINIDTCEVSYKKIDLLVDDNCFYKSDDNFYYNDNGAVGDAYYINESDDVEKQNNEKKKILDFNKLLYPEYDYILLPGKFPINASEISNYVLYIRNYKSYLKDSKKYIR